MRVAVIGAGYVGLVSGACFAELGFETWCIDKDRERVDMLLNGKCPIHEPQLHELLTTNHARGRLHFAVEMRKAVEDADIVLIAVGTPESDDGGADLSNVFEVAREIGGYLTGYTVVVSKSTVPVGTTRRIERTIRDVNPSVSCDVVSNPEFLREGHAVVDCMRPDRVVVGVESERARSAIRQLYRPLQLSGVTIQECCIETAELAKYAANSFLAMKIAFINQVADLAEIVHADVGEVARSMGLDPRIGSLYLQPGPGFGGSCFPKDTKAFARAGSGFGVPQTIVQSVIEANEQRKASLLERVRRAGYGSIGDKRIAVLGLAFKPDTDDCRDAPALDLLTALVDEGAHVSAYDPEAVASMRRALPEVAIAYRASAEEAIERADIVVILTEWDEFRRLDLKEVRKRMRGDVLVDFRNLFTAEEVVDAGLTYHSVGRVPASPGMFRKPAMVAAAE